MKRELRRLRPLLGTYVEMGVPASAGAEAAIAVAFERLSLIQHLLSFHDGNSELSRLNAKPGRWQTLHPLSLRVLRLAKIMTALSGHRFNCTLGGALIARGALPDHGGVQALPLGTAQDIDMRPGQARLQRPVRITLDGIAKGFAVDYALAALKQAGLSYGWINAGGDLRVFGDRVLPVTQRQENGPAMHLGGLCNAALASSVLRPQISEDFPGLILSGTRPEPASPATASATVFSVMARYAWRADALTKVAAVAPAPERATLVAALGGRLLENPMTCAA